MLGQQLLECEALLSRMLAQGQLSQMGVRRRPVDIQQRIAKRGQPVLGVGPADAHPLGARPFAREQYINKFRTLATGLVEEAEIDRFIAAAENLPKLAAGELDQLNITAAPGVVDLAAAPKGLF